MNQTTPTTHKRREHPWASRTTVLGLCAGLALGGFFAAQPAQADTMRWLTWKAKGAGDAMAENIQWFADEVEKRSNGELKINVMWGGSAASQNEIPDALSAGTGQIGDVVMPYYMNKYILNNAIGYYIPQWMNTLEVAELMVKWHQEYPQFDEELAKFNLKVVGYRSLEPYGMLCTKPIEDISDLKGRNVRSYGSAYPPLIKALGANPVTVSTTEAYQALQRGIIDCTPTGIMYTESFKYGEVAKYYVALPLGSNFGQFIVMNKRYYDGLSPELQAVIDEVGEESIHNFVDVMDEKIDEIKADWAKTGRVHYAELPNDVFTEVVKDPSIRKVQQTWVDAAKKAGLPAEDLAKELEFRAR